MKVTGLSAEDEAEQQRKREKEGQQGDGGGGGDSPDGALKLLPLRIPWEWRVVQVCCCFYPTVYTLMKICECYNLLFINPCHTQQFAKLRFDESLHLRPVQGKRKVPIEALNSKDTRQNFSGTACYGHD